MCVTVIEIIFVSNPSWEEEHRDLVQRWPFTNTSSFSQGGILSARTISPTLLHPSSSCTEQRQAHQIFLHLSPWLLINNLKTGLANGCVSAEMPVIQMVTFFSRLGIHSGVKLRACKRRHSKMKFTASYGLSGSNGLTLIYAAVGLKDTHSFECNYSQKFLSK